MKSEIEIIEDTIKKQKEQGMNELRIYKEAYEFTISELKSKESFETQRLNKQISKGINELMMRGDWINLHLISKHAIDCCLESSKKDDSCFMNSIVPIMEFKNFILNSGKAEYIDFLTDEAKAKFFPREEK